MTAVLAAPKPALLTAEHRAFLNDPGKRSMLTKDFTLYFIHRFGLDGDIAGRLLAQWSKELM